MSKIRVLQNIYSGLDEFALEKTKKELMEQVVYIEKLLQKRRGGDGVR